MVRASNSNTATAVDGAHCPKTEVKEKEQMEEPVEYSNEVKDDQLIICFSEDDTVNFFSLLKQTTKYFYFSILCSLMTIIPTPIVTMSSTMLIVVFNFSERPVVTRCTIRFCTKESCSVNQINNSVRKKERKNQVRCLDFLKTNNHPAASETKEV